MPGHDARMARGFVEHLVVPEPRAVHAEELSRFHGDRGMKDQIVESLIDEPCAEKVEDASGGVAKVVGVDLVEIPGARIASLPDVLETLAQRAHLRVIEDPSAFHVAMLAEERDVRLR